MDNFRIAVKAFIVDQNKLLLLKRKSDNPHKPGEWDIPGGRLEVGEDPYEGLQREISEETGMQAEIVMPLDVHHFVRDDGQKITMLIFLCRPRSEKKDILLSEHDEYKWVNLKEETKEMPKWLGPTLENFRYIKL